MKTKFKLLIVFLVVIFYSFGVKNDNTSPILQYKLNELRKIYNKKNSFEKQLATSKYIINNENLNDSLRFYVLNKITLISVKFKQVDSAIFYSKKMLDLDLEGKSNLKGKAYFKLGLYFSKINQKDSSYYYYNLSKNEYKLINDSINVGNRLRNISIIESDYGDYISSDSSAVEALKYLNGKNVNSIAAIYNTLAINYRGRNLYNESLKYYQKAIEITNSKRAKIIYRNNLANVYKEQKKYLKSISILESILNDSITELSIKARLIDNLAHIKWLNNENEKVLSDLNKAKSIREKEEDYYGLLASYSHLADYHTKTNKQLALASAKKMYVVSKKVKSPEDRIEAIAKIVALQPASKSYDYFQESIYLRDSLNESENKRQFRFAKIKYNYELEEKQKLKFKNSAIENELNVKKEKSQKRNILFASLFLTSGLLFFIYRRRQIHAKQLLQENYNTEIRLAKRLHDELGNDIFNTITKVQNTDVNPKEIIKDLDKLYHQTRSISHENDSIETGDKFELYFRDLLSSYNSDECKIILKDIASLELNKLKEHKQIVIYRVFNELLVNMKKHSKATLVVLSFQRNKNILEFKYADNGVGFPNKKNIFKNGLKNMEIRTKSIQGKITFESIYGKGLKVLIQITR